MKRPIIQRTAPAGPVPPSPGPPSSEKEIHQTYCPQITVHLPDNGGGTGASTDGTVASGPTQHAISIGGVIVGVVNNPKMTAVASPSRSQTADAKPPVEKGTKTFVFGDCIVKVNHSDLSDKTE
jgi:hypothetical protein